MLLLTILQFIINILIALVVIGLLVTGLVLLFRDKRQQQHSVLRNYPVLARVRYFFEKIGPELRQYLFSEDTKGNHFHVVNIQTS